MNKALLSIIAVVVLLALFGGYYLLKPSTAPSDTVAPGTGSGFPSDPNYVPYSSSSGQDGPGASDAKQMKVTASNGKTITVNDFGASQATTQDQYNEGHYYLGDTNPSTSSYSILYVASDQSFTITLQQEPIGSIRQEAEQKLLTILGIDKKMACHLRYWVGVPYAVNQVYAGKNLGFSFCAEATQL